MTNTQHPQAEILRAIADGIYTADQLAAAVLREREAFVEFIQNYPYWLGEKAKEEMITAFRSRGQA